MGVFHLMGLGRSAGVVTSPISYLAHRYSRWDELDQQFFAYSGEIEQRQQGEKVGDIQGLVLFSTKEVITGKQDGGKAFQSFDYIRNRTGQVTGKSIEGGPTQQVIPDILKGVPCKNIFGKRSTIDIFWCCIDRRDVQMTYERIIQTVASLATVGGQGKEIWINLTGGTNPVNFALQLAATLSGNGARLYYVQAQNEEAAKCIHFTAEHNYWLELPILPLTLDELNRKVLEQLEDNEYGLSELYSRLQNTNWSLMQNYDNERKFRDAVLAPMWKRTLIIGSDSSYSIGPQWSTIKPYEERWLTAQADAIPIEKLAQREEWIIHEQLCIS